jgi:molecular chaperone DnaK (HSP70)
MLQSPIVENNPMFDTLSFSKKMQKAGMTEMIADELAYSLRDMHSNHFESLLTKEEFQKFEKEIRSEIEDIRSEIDGLLTKEEFQKFEKEIRSEIENIHNEFEKMVTKKEFDIKIKNLELSITIKMGLIMATGISVLGLMIKM